MTAAPDGPLGVRGPGFPDLAGALTIDVGAGGLARAAPPEWTRFVCVETANVGADAVLLPAGGGHAMGVEIAVGGPDPG